MKSCENCVLKPKCMDTTMLADRVAWVSKDRVLAPLIRKQAMELMGSACVDYREDK